MKAKRIIGLVVSVVVLLFATSVLVSALVPKNFNFNLAEPDRIVVYDGNATIKGSYEKNTEEYKQILELYNNGLKTSFLKAFFQGKGFGKVQTVDSTTYFNNSKMDSENYYIEFGYFEAQNTDKHGCNVDISTAEQTYNYIIIEVKNSQSLTDINAYLRKDDNISNNSYIKYTSSASHSALYKYLDELI